jgi:hypothetical protein
MKGLADPNAGQTRIMLLRTLATTAAAGRVAYGSALVMAPAAFAGPWIGSHAGERRMQIMVRGFGVRDFVLGAGGLWSLRAGGADSARWWFAAQGACDAADLATTLAAGGALSRPVKLGVVALAAGAAAINWSVAARADAIAG